MTVPLESVTYVPNLEKLKYSADNIFRYIHYFYISFSDFKASRGYCVNISAILRYFKYFAFRTHST
jgi:hypothetical protein